MYFSRFEIEKERRGGGNFICRNVEISVQHRQDLRFKTENFINFRPRHFTHCKKNFRLCKQYPERETEIGEP